MKKASSKDKRASGIDRVVKSFISQMESDPTFGNEAIQKLAFWGDLKDLFRWSGEGGMQPALKQYLPMAGAAALTSGALAAGTGLAGKAYDAVRDTIMRSKGYRNMVEQHGDMLSEVPAERAEKIYKTLYRFNPEFASDPLVAASFVRRVHALDQLDIGEIKSLVDARKTIAQTPETGFTQHVYDTMAALPKPAPMQEKRPPRTGGPIRRGRF